MRSCQAHPYEKSITEQESFILQRLTYEINGYEVLIREFAIVDAEFEIDKEKWDHLFKKKAEKSAALEEAVSILCDHDFNGSYSVDFSAKKIRWGAVA